MIRLLNNFDLLQNNTFHLKAIAKNYFEFTESEELLFFLEKGYLTEPYLILGGGSNMLFQNNFDGLVIHPNIPGIFQVNEDRNHIYLEAGAGVEWDELVDYAVKYDLGGLENLSLIPGKVGASPVQNIGAYGVEVKDCIHLVKGIDLHSGKREEFFNADCKFGYRNSIFKNELKNQIVVTSVVFKLDKFPVFILDYGALKSEVEKLGDLTLANVRKAVITIRESKLPDPKLIGNAGSFFKNPIVDQLKADKLKEEYANVPIYNSSEHGKVKLAAGWLIDQCGWKGYRLGDAGVHTDQALVLVNYGNATGIEILSLSEKIRSSVFEKFGVLLEPEVNMV
jgi:UDP-N-acetylmuramate dehydrogenase